MDQSDIASINNEIDLCLALVVDLRNGLRSIPEGHDTDAQEFIDDLVGTASDIGDTFKDVSDRLSSELSRLEELFENEEIEGG